MSKLQYKNPLYQTHQDDRMQSDSNGFNTQNEKDDLAMFTNCFSPMSDRLVEIDKLNVLSRTASMDHYLSNCTTFLRGQRFLSPTSK